MWNLYSKFSTALSLFLLGFILYISAPVNAATATGSLSCASSTSNSITVGLSYANNGTAAANLYRYGAPGNGQIASYPGPSGSGRHVDTGLSGSYRYQLRTGTTVLATVECVTKPIQPPAPTPAPNPAPRPATQAPAPPPPAPAPAPVAAPVAPPTPAPVLPAEEEFSIEELPDASPEQDTDEPAVTAPTDSDNSGSAGPLIIAGVVTGLLLAGAGLFLFIMRRRQHTTSSTSTSRGDLDALTVPSILPAPIQDANSLGIPMPQPTTVASPQTASFDRSIDKAFYPSRLAAATTLADDKAHEIPDMYTVANQHPESFGNVNYLPVITDQPPAGPVTDKTVNIQNRTIVSEPPAVLRITH